MEGAPRARKRAAWQGSPIRNDDLNSTGTLHEIRDALQVERVARAYALTYATAVTVASLAFGSAAR